MEEYGYTPVTYLDGELEVCEPQDDGYTMIRGSEDGEVFVPTSKLRDLATELLKREGLNS